MRERKNQTGNTSSKTKGEDHAFLLSNRYRQRVYLKKEHPKKKKKKKPITNKQNKPTLKITINL